MLQPSATPHTEQTLLRSRLLCRLGDGEQKHGGAVRMETKEELGESYVHICQVRERSYCAPTPMGYIICATLIHAFPLQHC